MNRLLTEEVRLKRQIQHCRAQQAEMKKIFKQHLPKCPMVASRVRKMKEMLAQRNQRSQQTATPMRQNSGPFAPVLTPL